MSEGRYDTFLQVRLTTHDKERIKARAIEAGMQTSEYVRKRALGERLRDRGAIPGRLPVPRTDIGRCLICGWRDGHPASCPHYSPTRTASP